MKTTAITIVYLFTLIFSPGLLSADLNREQVIELLKDATKDKPANLRRKDLKRRRFIQPGS